MPIASYAYTVGPAGNRLTANETVHPNGIPNTINRICTYDDVYRLTREDISVGGTSSPASLNYFYDSVGNRLARQSTLPALLPQLFSHDPNDRLNTDTYDANGNTLFGIVPASGVGFGAPPTTLGCAYDFENRLIRATTADGKTVHIWYDGDGHRVKKTVVTATNTVTIFYVVDNQNPTGYAQVLEEHVSLDSGPANLDCVYTYGLMLISQRRAIGTTGPGVCWVASFYGYDGHNNVRYLTGTAGNITDTFDYDAFGNLISRTGDTPNNYFYCGEQLDPDLGLYFLRARYLNPDTGRFWTMDDFEGGSSDPFSLHKYLYAHANPVSLRDPSGRESLIGVVFSSGVRALLQKMTMPHTRTAVVFIGSYALGFGLGIQGPAATIALLSAAGAGAALIFDILGRGAVAQRGEIARLIGISFTTALAVAQFYNNYIQRITFMGSMGLIGFATGYATGMIAYYRLHSS